MTIPEPMPEKFRPLTHVKRGHHTSRLPRKFAEVNADLARTSMSKRKAAVEKAATMRMGEGK